MPEKDNSVPLAPSEKASDLLLEEKAEHLCHSSGVAAAVNAVIATLLYLSLPEPRADWLWSILIVSALRFGLYLRCKEPAKERRQYLFRYRIALVVIALQGIAWGFSSLVLYPTYPVSHRLYLLAVLIGLTGGSVLTLTPSFTAFAMFVAPAITPLVYLLIVEETDIFRNIGFMGLIYVMAVHAIARKINLSALEQNATRQKLERANAQLNTYKNELETLVAERTRDLQLSEERYRDSFEKAVVGMAVQDLDGRFIRTNSAFQKILGFSADELAQMTFLEVTHPEDREGCRNHYQDAIDRSESEVTLEKRYLRKTGEIVEAMISYRVVRNGQGRPQYAVAQIMDISERKQIEREQVRLNERLRQSQKMEAIGTLAGGIAHDFNNILAAILGYTQLAQYRLADHPKEKATLDGVIKAANRAKQLVQQILVFGRQREERHEQIELGPVVQEALDLLRSTISATISIQSFIDPQALTILGDPHLIQQVVINLGTNAYHAVRDMQGTIKVRVEPVNISPQNSAQHPDLPLGDYAQLTVEDSGTGMPPEVRLRIFEPFFTTKKQGEGTGMGLAVVYGIVQNHGGMIEVESSEGSGTIFRLYFPLSDGGQEKNAEDQAGLQLGSERILFVDDEAPLASLGKLTLEALGYQVTATTSPVEALEIFRNNADYFDLVISDQSMPEMSGDQLVREILQIRPDIPVVLCTGFSSAVDKTTARELGARALLFKPIDQAFLARALREILDADSEG